MTCNPVEFVRGATLDEAKLIDPIISGGEIRQPVIDDPTLTGSISLDEAALKALADLLEPLISKLSPDEIAGVFRSCRNNLPLTAGTQIPTCLDMEEAVEDIREEAAESLSDLRDEVLAVVEAKTDPAAIAGVFKNSDGAPLSPGTTLLSKAEIETLIRLAVCEGCGSGGGGGGGEGPDFGDTITSMNWNAAGNVLNTTVRYSDGSTQTWPVSFADFSKAPTTSDKAPLLASDPVMPASSFGGRAAWLGAPAVWMNLPGTDYIFPVYEKEV